jgi:hypothetical protein
MRRYVAIALLPLCASCVGIFDQPGGSSGPPGGPPGGPPNQSAVLAPTPIHRLAKSYLENAVADFASSFDAAPRAAFIADVQSRLDLIPGDVSPFYSSNDDQVTQDHVDAVVGLSIAVAARVADPTSGYAAQLVKMCGAGLDGSALAGDACLTKFLQYYLRKVYRRPPAQAEIDDFKAFYKQAVAASTDGLAMLVGRMIAHPSFYYRFDWEGTKLSGTDGVDAVYQLTSYELLAKITFLFWAAPPDDALYDQVAKAGDITSDAALAPIVDQVLADPRARAGVLGFYGEWLTLDKTQMPATDGNVLAGKSLVTAAGLTDLPASHRDDMVQEVLDLAQHYTLDSDGTLDDILTSQYSFARTPALATIYGVQPWDGTKTNLVPLPAGQRSGLITRAAMLASNQEYTRPIIKGEHLRTRLLCTPISPPPPNINIKPLTHPADQTTRQVIEQLTSDPVCNACHGQFNALGFLSEDYDPLGRYRTKEVRFVDGTATIASQLPVSTAAVAAVKPGDTTMVADAVALSQAIAQSGVAHDCMVQNYFQFVHGRAVDPNGDGAEVTSLTGALHGQGGTIKQMLRASAMQPSFRTRKVD